MDNLNPKFDGKPLIFLRPWDWHEDVYNVDQITALPGKEDWIVQNVKPNRDEDYLRVVEGI